MKKLIVATALVTASTFTFAAGGHGPSGCGLGSNIIMKDADEWHEHVLAATTNGTSGNQTFGMTSGTLGCADAGGPLSTDIQQYIDGNLDQLAADTARGEGDSLAALADLMDIENADRTLFNQSLQANFDKLFQSENTTSGEAAEVLSAIMSADKTLSKYV
ncbi:MAG: DUF3015 family protein [Pseudomonadales bacterium]|jgi:hypothetical protein|nr:DUF3015 family protein [Pseudomonadales bacterium]